MSQFRSIDHKRVKHHLITALLLCLLPLSGCGVLTIDVDVYKGKLLNEEKVQVEQVAALAIAAKPLLVNMRYGITDKPEHRNNALFDGSTDLCANAHFPNAVLSLYEDMEDLKARLTNNPEIIRTVQEADEWMQQYMHYNNILGPTQTTVLQAKLNEDWKKIEGALKKEIKDAKDGPRKHLLDGLKSIAKKTQVERKWPNEILAEAEVGWDQKTDTDVAYDKLKEEDTARKIIKKAFTEPNSQIALDFKKEMKQHAEAFLKRREAVQGLIKTGLTLIIQLEQNKYKVPKSILDNQPTIAHAVTGMISFGYISHTSEKLRNQLNDLLESNNRDAGESWWKELGLITQILSGSTDKSSAKTIETASLLLKINEDLIIKPNVNDENYYPYGLARGSAIYDTEKLEIENKESNTNLVATVNSDKIKQLFKDLADGTFRKQIQKILSELTASGFEHGRPEKGLNTLVQEYIVASSQVITEPHANNEAKLTRARKELLNALIHFSEKVLFAPTFDSLLNKRNPIFYLHWHNVKNEIKESDSRLKPDSRGTYYALQAISNLILVHVNEITEQYGYKETMPARLKNYATGFHVADARSSQWVATRLLEMSDRDQRTADYQQAYDAIKQIIASLESKDQSVSMGLDSIKAKLKANQVARESALETFGKAIKADQSDTVLEKLKVTPKDDLTDTFYTKLKELVVGKEPDDAQLNTLFDQKIKPWSEKRDKPETAKQWYEQLEDLIQNIKTSDPQQTQQVQQTQTKVIKLFWTDTKIKAKDLLPLYLEAASIKGDQEKYIKPFLAKIENTESPESLVKKFAAKKSDIEKDIASHQKAMISAVELVELYRRELEEVNIPKHLKDPKEVLDIAGARLQRIHIDALANGDHPAANNAQAALNKLEEYRGRMTHIRPASAFLRSSMPITSLQEQDPPSHWRNMLTGHWARQIPLIGEALVNEGNQTYKQVAADLDRVNWHNINRVRVAGGGLTNYVVTKDDLGNWTVKNYHSDPEQIFQSISGMTTAAITRGMSRDDIKTVLKNQAEQASLGTTKQLDNLKTEHENKVKELLKQVEATYKALPDKLNEAWKAAGKDKINEDQAAKLKEIHAAKQKATEAIDSQLKTKKENMTMTVDDELIFWLQELSKWSKTLEAAIKEGQYKQIKEETKEEAKPTTPPTPTDTPAENTIEADTQKDEHKTETPPTPEPKDTVPSNETMIKAATEILKGKINSPTLEYAQQHQTYLDTYYTQLQTMQIANRN